MEASAGVLFAGYRIERRLGVGGMGVVYLAQHPRLPRKDALKILSDQHTDDAEFRARFLREAEIAARLQHPNLVAVRDRGEQDGRLWIAMQYVPGIDVAELIRRGPLVLDVARAVWIVTEAARGLDEIHRAGLLHRDVKPANILLAEQPGGPDRVLVTDFGIARPVDDSTTLAAAEGMTATLAYAAPEQIRGEPANRGTDVYALGCTLFHVLTGVVPFPRDSAGAIMYAHLQEPPPRPSAINARVPGGFDAVVARAMAKDPAQRYPSCGALAAAAHEALTGTGPADGALAGTRSGAKRRGLLLGALAVVIAVAAVSISLLVRMGPDTSAPVAVTTRPPAVHPAAWGSYQYIAEAFPELLPYTPLSVGYRELTSCQPVDHRGDSVAWDAPAQRGNLFCIGNGDPVTTMNIVCNADRSRITPGKFSDRVEGDERWTRASGTGHLWWGSNIDARGDLSGVINVYFDDPGRNFCYLRLHGAKNGAQLRTQWWADAPI